MLGGQRGTSEPFSHPSPFPAPSSHLLTAPALGGEEHSAFSVIGPGLVEAEGHFPGPIGTAVPVGTAWGQKGAVRAAGSAANPAVSLR